jgi:hypothetical protein
MIKVACRFLKEAERNLKISLKKHLFQQMHRSCNFISMREPALETKAVLSPFSSALQTFQYLLLINIYYYLIEKMYIETV